MKLSDIQGSKTPISELLDLVCKFIDIEFKNPPSNLPTQMRVFILGGVKSRIPLFDDYYFEMEMPKNWVFGEERDIVLKRLNKEGFDDRKSYELKGILVLT